MHTARCVHDAALAQYCALRKLCAFSQLCLGGGAVMGLVALEAQSLCLRPVYFLNSAFRFVLD